MTLYQYLLSKYCVSGSVLGVEILKNSNELDLTLF